MKKRNTLWITIIFSGICATFAFAGNVFAYGGAIVSWEAPTTDEGDVTPQTGLTGYRVYYSISAIDCTDWDVANQTDRQANTGNMLPATYRTVAGGSVLSYMFNDTSYLTPGSTYNFAVVAYDDSGNLSQCATGANEVTSVSKLVSYSADTDSNRNVNYLDYGTFHNNYHTNNSVADFDKSGYVDYLDYNILHNDYNHCFSTGCP